MQRVSQEKDLGVTFDERLTFEQHILEKVKKEIQTMGLIRRSYSYLDIQSFIWLFKAMVRHHTLNTCNLFGFRSGRRTL